MKTDIRRLGDVNVNAIEEYKEISERYEFLNGQRNDLVEAEKTLIGIIDELDAKLHPKLLRYIISLFKKKQVNQKGAQLIFTSHDMTTLKNTVFRRDEIWFAALNDTHSSEIYSLYEIRREDNERVNNTAAYDKQYLEGRYGADPYLQNMLTGGEWK